MIEPRSGDILKADAEALVNTVNCVGIMGRGLALQFKNAFPQIYEAYAAACKRQEVRPGRMFVFETGNLSNPKYIVNFPTKRHWRGKSRMEDIESGLLALAGELSSRGIRSIAVPPLGSGLGGLDWKQVRQRIEAALGHIPSIAVFLYEPLDPKASKPETRTGKVPDMTSGRAALVGLMRRYLDGLMDPFVTLLEVHKLLYFMQEGGEPLRLRYVQAPYGPYAENLRHVLREIEGYFVSGYSDGGDAPAKELALFPGAIDEAEEFLASHPETRTRFERVADLVKGFETSFGLELLATVHWVATRGGSSGADEVIEGVYAWNARKRQFSTYQIRLALEVLAKKGWLGVAPSIAAS